MTGNEIHCLMDGVGGVLKAVEPLPEIDAAVFHQGDMFLADTTLLHNMEHLVGIHPLNTASGVSYHHYLVDPQLINSHKQRTHSGVKRVGDGAPGVLDYLDIAVSQT